MHSGFRALRSELPMNIGATKTAHSHTATADSDMRRIMHIWRDCLERFGGGPFLFGPFSAADIMYAPVVTRFETYGVVLDEICRTYADRIMDWPAMVEWCDTAKAEPWQIEMYDKA
jgi:glutathione S-transferase